MKLCLSKQLWLFLGAFVFCVATQALFSGYFIKKVNSQFDNVANVQLPAVRSMTLADMMHDGLRGVVMEALLQSTQGHKDKLDELAKEIGEKSADFEKYLGELDQLPLQEQTKKAIADTKPEMAEYIRLSKEMVETCKEKGAAASIEKMDQFAVSFKSLEDKMEHLGELIEKDAASAKSDGDFFERAELIMSASIMLVGFIFGYLLISKLLGHLKMFVEKIEDSGVGVSQFSNELSKASSEMAQSASQSAASIQESVASLEEMSAMIKMNSENAAMAQKVSTESKISAETGNQGMQSLIGSMSEISIASKKMGEIITAIDDIAFQTNLLALNAAVEAARAGEQGKGFAVVAEAVRSLAQRASVAAKDISNMIQNNDQKIQVGGSVADKSGVALKEIVDSVLKVSSLNTEIAESSRNQANGISQLSAVMNSMDETSQKNAAVAEQVSASSAEISKQADDLKSNVVQFREILFGSKAG